ncbi:hypothetical protein [Paenibacillus paeoniae]|uniref:Uncharacterized protein n=1 Tax=Paenibacillus paeoniae TaxID=2292705 RepID=A0A371PJF6_9BACL|nr:hypothetical protein [Paenibacillus paeoniae]REK76341.1 hypothetical protein DX130_04665 [Paenibacillus paeoniae]
MNQYSQQPAQFQGGQQQYSNSNANQNYEPAGYVQSHYQGQLSQPTFNRESANFISPSYNNAGSQHSHSYGYQQHAAPAIHSYTQPAVSNHAYQSHQPVQSHASSPATAFGDVGPVIARYGYQADQQQHQNYSQQYGQQSFYQPAPYAQHTQSQFSGYQSQAPQGYSQSHGPVHSNTSLNPVYQATNAYEQAGPVISKLGWQSSSANSNSQYSR